MAARASAGTPAEGRQRVVVSGVSPELDGGRFPIKRLVGEQVAVEADVFADGHDELGCELCYRRASADEWLRAPMLPLGNDRWRGAFGVDELGEYRYTIRAWIDRFATWSRDLGRRVADGQDVAGELADGARLVNEAADGAAADAARLRELAAVVAAGGEPALACAGGDELAALMRRRGPRPFATAYPLELRVVVDRPRAGFGAWYEVFPRSCAGEPGRHGTLADVEGRLPYIAELGFDVLYLPPIHPIGRQHRKGPNNRPQASSEDPGSPWAIGSEDGGHRAIHPELGTLADFRRLRARAEGFGLEIALDLAFQCSPDHPYVREHPEWFRHRPDGAVRYAENPPKRYEDIYPFDFECAAWRELWTELAAVVAFWVGEGVRIFRVDNPHTKPFAFWEWLIAATRRAHPDVLFLAEAFTRPRVMERLAKLGFSQSYTYFAWRNHAADLGAYMRELASPPLCEYFRPNLWPNTPDILTEYLQHGGRPAFAARVVLAATLGPSYGIYGPAFEQGVDRPLAPGREEYLDSEKYQIRCWDFDAGRGLGPLLQRLNRIRRAHPALQRLTGLRLQPCDNEQILAYSKRSADGADVILCVVNMDPHHRQSGWVTLGLDELGVPSDQPYQLHDLLSDARYSWRGPRGYVELDPQVMPAHVFALQRRVRREADFDYYV